jgi:hypothetical protein
MRFERNRQDVGKVSQIGDKFSGIGGVDLYTKLLLHFDGDIKDDSSFAHPVGYAKCLVDNTQSVFGGYSLKILNASTEYLNFPASADWYLSGDFTIDFWVRFSIVPPASTKKDIMCGQYKDADEYWYCCLRNDGSGNLDWYLTCNNAGVSVNSGLVHSNPKVVINQWYHVAFTRSGSDWSIFQDGVKLSTNSDAGALLDLSTYPLYLGYYGSSTEYHNGWIDEFRLSKGIVRWTADFTPPTAPYSKKNWE